MCLFLLQPRTSAVWAELNVLSENLTPWDAQHTANPGVQYPHTHMCHASITEPFGKWCLRKLAWSSLRNHIMEIKLGKATQGLSALEGGQTELLTKRLHSQSWKMVSLLFWEDNQQKDHLYRVRLPHSCREMEKGAGTSCQPSSPAPYTSPCLGSTCTSGFPEGFHGGCSTADQQLWPKIVGKCRPCCAGVLLLSSALAVHRKSEL